MRARQNTREDGEEGNNAKARVRKREKDTQRDRGGRQERERGGERERSIGEERGTQ